MSRLNRGPLKTVFVLFLILLLPMSGNTQPAETVSQEEDLTFHKAKTFIQKGQWVEGIQTLELFLVNYPNSPITPDVLIALGDALMRQGDLKRAVEPFHIFLERFPRESRVHDARYQLSQVYLRTGEVQEALSLWKGIAGQEELKTPVYNRATEIYVEREEYLRALRVLILRRDLLVDSAEAEPVVKAMSAIVEHRLSEKELQTVVSEFGVNAPADEALIRLIKFYDERETYYLEEKEINRFLALFPNHAYSTEAQKGRNTIRTKLKTNQYLIAVLLPLSGRLSPFGTSALQGMQLALHQLKEDLPGAPLSLLVRDYQDDSAKNPKELEEWLNDYKPLGIVGPLLSREVNQVAPLAERGGWALITPGASAATLSSMGKTVFRNATTPTSQCQAIAEYAVLTLGLKRFAILFPNERSGREAMSCLTKKVTQLGGTVVLAKPYTPNETDFKDPILQLKAVYGQDDGDEGKKEKGEAGFDAIFLPGEAREAGLIIPQLVFHGVKNVTMLGTMGWNSPEFLKLVGPHAEGAIFVDGFFLGSPDPLVQNFIREYRKQFQQDPDLFAAQAYDTARLLLETIKQGALTRSEIKAALAATKDFPGVSGHIFEIKNGEAIKKPFFIQVKKGKFQVDE